MFKVGSVVVSDTADVEMRDPETGAPLGWVVTVAGPEHPLHSTKILERQRKLRVSMTLESREKVIERALDEESQNRLDLVCTCVIAWRGLVDGNGAEILCNPQEVRVLFGAKGHSWMVDQIAEALADKARFLMRSASS